MKQILFVLNESTYEVEELDRTPSSEDNEYIYASITADRLGIVDVVSIEYQYLDHFGSIRVVRDAIHRNSGAGIFSLIEAVNRAVEHTCLPKMDFLFTAYVIAEMLHIDGGF